MATYSYEATGGLTTSGCAGPNVIQRFYEFQYDIGSTVYILKKAIEGILEKVVIKRVNLVGPEVVLNYVDRTNRIWFENELILKSDAEAIASASLERKLSIIGKLNSCNNSYTIENVAVPK